MLARAKVQGRGDQAQHLRGTFIRERRRDPPPSNRAVGEPDIEVVPPAELHHGVAQRRVAELEPAVEPREMVIHRHAVLGGQPISVENGKCVNADGTLAGSDLDMASAVRNAVSVLGLDLADAVSMASTNPAAFLRLGDQVGRIAPGYRANMVLLDEDLRVVESWIDGVRLGAA